MIERIAAQTLRFRASQFRVVTVTGPRQAGKTTLCCVAFPDKPYLSLERPDVLDYATRDPAGFLASVPDGAILDEVQRAPALLSWLQDDVDRNRQPGRWIVTGSHHLALHAAVSQSLAGRTALLSLLPFDLDESERAAGPAPTPWHAVWRGGYPEPLAQGMDLPAWLSSYVGTYLERDVREVIRVTDLVTFQGFLRLCAARSGQLLNLSALAQDAGVSQPTAKAWFSALEATFVVFRAPPWHANLGKREVKTPKLFFWDTGLACWLLRILAAEQLELHPLRGALFENWVAVELAKSFLHRGQPHDLAFFRDHKGFEIDLVREAADRVLAVEVKSSATASAEFFRLLTPFAGLVRDKRPDLPRVDAVAVYAGREDQARTVGRIVGWRSVGQVGR